MVKSRGMKWRKFKVVRLLGKELKGQEFWQDESSPHRAWTNFDEIVYIFYNTTFHLTHHIRDKQIYRIERVEKKGHERDVLEDWDFYGVEWIRIFISLKRASFMYNKVGRKITKIEMQ